MEIGNPHDKFFKATFGRPDIAVDFLAHYLPPQVAAVFTLSAPELVKDSFIDPALQEHFSDLIYRLRLRGGGTAYAYLLFEHKSAPEQWVALQLLRYKVQAWERLANQKAKKLPPILPIVIYHGQRRWRIPRKFGALVAWDEAEVLRRYVAEFEYLLVDLSAFSDAQIVGAALIRVGLLTLKYAFTDELIERLPKLARLLPVREQSALEYFVTVIRYVSETTRPLTRSEFEGLKAQLPKEEGELMETMASAWIKEGRAEGRQEAGVELTLRLLQRRIGTVDARTQARLRKLSFEQLMELGEALLDFNSPRDLTAWLRAHAGKAS